MPTLDKAAALRLQLLIVTRGVATLALDGIVGPRTRAAVAQAQHNAGLAVTGEPDDALLEALRSTAIVKVKVPRVQTQLTPQEVSAALVEGHRRLFDFPPSASRLRIARAQCAIEHGPDGRAIHCFNLGNVMTGKTWAGPWFRMSATEGEAGKEVLRSSTWRAAAEPAEGGFRYWEMLRTTFSKALARFDADTPEGVAHALKTEPTGCYYTAAEGDYARVMRDVWRRLG